MSSFRELFADNRKELAALLARDFLPSTEESRRRGFGEFVEAHTPAATGDLNGGVPALAAAYNETQDGRYAEAARDRYAEWVRSRPKGGAWATSTESVDVIGHGLPVYLGQLHVFLTSSHFDDEFLREFVECALFQMDYLAQHFFPDRNLRFSYSVGLLRAALCLRFLPEAQPFCRRRQRSSPTPAIARYFRTDRTRKRRPTITSARWVTFSLRFAGRG